MLNIGNKKYRNMPEQVAYNTECIKRLDEYLDGIAIEDKLVVIETDSGTFTDEELVILSGPLAFISNGSRVWMKDSETLLEFVFKAIDIVATEVGGACFNVGGSKIVINRETGAYNTSSDTIITTYNKSQIDSIIANIIALLDGKASLTGATFSGAVKALTLEQTNPNYSINFNMVGGSPATEALTITQIYNRFQVINNRLSIIFNFKIKNETASNITCATGGVHFDATINLDSNIATKLIDINGISAHGIASPTYTFISGLCLQTLKNGVGYSATQIKSFNASLYNRNVEDRVALLISSDASVVLSPDDELYISGRALLDLI